MSALSELLGSVARAVLEIETMKMNKRKIDALYAKQAQNAKPPAVKEVVPIDLTKEALADIVRLFVNMDYRDFPDRHTVYASLDDQGRHVVEEAKPSE